MLNLDAVNSHKTDDEHAMTNIQEHFLSVPEGYLTRQISVKLLLVIRHRYTGVLDFLSRKINYQPNEPAYCDNRVIYANPMEPLGYGNMFPVASRHADAIASSDSKEMMVEAKRRLKMISSSGYHRR